MSHIRNVGLQRISYSNKPGACQAQKRCSKSPHNFTKRRAPFWGQKTGSVWGSVFYVDIARYSFSNMEPKKGSIFPPQNWGFVLLFFCCCYCTFAPEGWFIFIRISNSGRPIVLIVGSWFVVWLLNNRPALHTGRIRFTYPALKVVLKPLSWNHQKALFRPKTTSALWPHWT